MNPTVTPCGCKGAGQPLGFIAAPQPFELDWKLIAIAALALVVLYQAIARRPAAKKGRR